MDADDAMREELRNLGAKLEDLQRQVNQLPTRDDLSPFATKDDLVVFKDEIISNFRLLSEDAKDSVKKAAEGYGATLDRIERDVVLMNRKMDDGLADRTKVLADHNRRLVRLERGRRR